MSIQSGYDKYKRYQKVDDDNYKLISHWTSSNTVHFDDNTTAEEKVAEIDNSINEINTSIGNINTSIDDIEGDLSNLNTEVENLKETTSTSNENITKLESEKATRTELAETNENLTGLTDRFNYHEENSQKAELISYDNSISRLTSDKVQDAIDDINAKADEAITVAKGKNRSTVFDTTQDMYAWLSNVDNKEKCQVGDNLYIKAVDVPDWWVSEVLTEADPDTGYYYKVAQLETQKVDLGSLEDGLAEELAKLDDALIWQGQISGDDWAIAQLGVWNTTTANETYGIPEYSVIYKPRPTSFLGAFLNCYSTGEQKGIYAWDASTSKFVRLPRMDELDTKVANNFTANRAVYANANGELAASDTITDTELGYLSGAKSNIQTQLDAKLPLAGGTLTGSIYTGAVYPSKSSTYYCGRIAEPWAGVYSNNFTIIGSDNKSYVVTKATLGTTSTSGTGDIWLGTNIAEGTAGNAKGRVILYNSGSRYAVIQDNDSATGNRTLTLPSKSGTIPVVSVSGTTLNINF